MCKVTKICTVISFYTSADHLFNTFLDPLLGKQNEKPRKNWECHGIVMKRGTDIGSQGNKFIFVGLRLC